MTFVYLVFGLQCYKSVLEIWWCRQCVSGVYRRVAMEMCDTECAPECVFGVQDTVSNPIRTVCSRIRFYLYVTETNIYVIHFANFTNSHIGVHLLT